MPEQGESKPGQEESGSDGGFDTEPEKRAREREDEGQHDRREPEGREREGFPTERET